MLSLREALLLVFAMGAVILFCRVFPFLFFGRGNIESPKTRAFLNFIEMTVPPVAMTVLAFNAIGSSFLGNYREGVLVLMASIFTALVHLWKRNALISIISGTALYIVLQKVIIQNMIL